MGWNALPVMGIIIGLWTACGAIQTQVNWVREEKPMWAYNKDFYQRALLRRDWYLKREAETFSMAKK